MKRAVGVFIALVFGVLAGGMQNHSQAKVQKQEATSKPGETLTGARYLGLDEPREWIYEVTFDIMRVFYSPYFVNSPISSSSITHGFREAKTRSVTFSIKSSGPYKDQAVSVALDDAGKRFWFAPSVCNSELVVVRSGSAVPKGHPWTRKGLDDDGQWKPLQPFPAELLALELRITLCSKDNKPMDLMAGEILGIVPADGSSHISRYGWVSARATEPIAVPAGTYSRVIYSKFPRGDGDAPRHVVESWVAEGVGLIKYRVTEKGKFVYTVVLKSVRKVE